MVYQEKPAQLVQQALGVHGVFQVPRVVLVNQVYKDSQVLKV